MSEIRDEKLAPSGRRKIDWVKDHMPVLGSIREDFKKTKPAYILKSRIMILTIYRKYGKSFVHDNMYIRKVSVNPETGKVNEMSFLLSKL